MAFVETPYVQGFKIGYVPFVVSIVPGVAFFSVVWATFTSPFITTRSMFWRPSAADYHVHEIIVERRSTNTVQVLPQMTVQMQHESVPGFFGADFIVAGGAEGDINRVGSRRRYTPPLTLPFTDPGTALGNQGIRPLITALASTSADILVAITVQMTQGTPVE